MSAGIRSLLALACLALVAGAFVAVPSHGAVAATGTDGVELELVTSGLSKPTDIAAPEGDERLDAPSEGPGVQVGGHELAFEIRAYRAPRLKSQIVFVRDGYGPNDTVQATLAESNLFDRLPDPFS